MDEQTSNIISVNLDSKLTHKYIEDLNFRPYIKSSSLDNDNNNKQNLSFGEIFQRLDDIKQKSIHFSDVIDNENKNIQYVDLVMEGGGVLGLALVGYTYALERVGIKFMSIAGTSAGAINAMMLACVDEEKNKYSTSSELLLDYISEKNFKDFLDGNSVVKWIILKAVKLLSNEPNEPELPLWKKLLAKKKSKYIISYIVVPLLVMLTAGIFAIKKVSNFTYKRFGLFYGDNFYNWIKAKIEENGIKSTKELINKRNEIIDKTTLRPASNNNYNITDRLSSKVVIIASDVTTNTKVEFPDYSALYYNDIENVHPADFVRASMSIPLFFYPFVLHNNMNAETRDSNYKDVLPLANQKIDLGDLKKNIQQDYLINNINEEIIISNNTVSTIKRLWYVMARYGNNKSDTIHIPNRIHLVDGGLMSNFPINVFHRQGNNVPRKPTFGVKLGVERMSPNENTSLLKFLSNIFDTSRQILDFDFILKNPQYEDVITIIDTKDFFWLDFEMNDIKKKELIHAGLMAALNFLENFQWEQYKLKRSRNLTNQYL